MSLGQNIAKLRKSMGLTQEQLAEKCDVSRQAVAKWESGESDYHLNIVILLHRQFICYKNLLSQKVKMCTDVMMIQ